MRSYSKTTLLGNVGQDPTIKYTADGTCIAKFSLATTEKYKNRAGEQVEDVSWHNIFAFGKLAELIGEYVKKGDPLFVEGRLRYSRSTGQDGVEKFWTEIKVDEMRLLGGKRDSASGGERPQRSAPAQRSEPAPANPSFDDVPFDDDIPF